MSLYAKERPEYLRQSLDSVFDQTLPPDEVVLVLDGPITTDLTEVVKSFVELHPELKLVPLEKNVGLGRALNEGLKHCSNELVARMDTDDICFPNRFDEQIKYMDDHSEIDIISSWISEFEDSVNNIKSIRKVPETAEDSLKYIKSRSPLNHPATVFRKSAVNAAGGYQHFTLFEDWYLFARMAANGSKIANIQHCLLYFRVSSDTYKRRGGWRYAKNNFILERKLVEMGLSDNFTAFFYGIAKGIVFLLPNTLRAFVYNKLLRN